LVDPETVAYTPGTVGGQEVGKRKGRPSYVAAGATANYPTSRFGAFRLLESLGRGDKSTELFRGLWCKGPGEPELMCVVKRLSSELVHSPTFVSMFEEEVRVLAQLDHPNIVHTLESGTCEGAPYVVLEWLDGLDLRRVLKSQRKEGREFPIEVAIHVAREVALALAHAHAAQDANGNPLHLVHRDVRPDNIVLLRSGKVKLGEFGVARASSFISLSITIAGISRRKPAYLAPEQISGRPIDHRADLFSLGVVLWEMLTGRPLFPPTSPREAAARVLQADLVRPSAINSEVPAELDALVMRLLDRTPSRRVQEATQVARELGALLPVPADAVRGLAMLVRGCVDSKTPTPVPIGPALVYPLTLMMPVLTAALRKGAQSLRDVSHAVSIAVTATPAVISAPARPVPRDPDAPTTEIDLEPAALADPDNAAAAASTTLARSVRRRRFASLLRITSRDGLLLVFGSVWQRLRSITGHSRPRH
jgi:serine/threonine protein kinase